MQPLSPEILKSNIKYSIDCKDGYRYVGFFHRLMYCCGNCVCVFTYERNGKGGVVHADSPANISDMVFAPKAKCGIFKGKDSA